MVAEQTRRTSAAAPRHRVDAAPAPRGERRHQHSRTRRGGTTAGRGPDFHSSSARSISQDAAWSRSNDEEKRGRASPFASTRPRRRAEDAGTSRATHGSAIRWPCRCAPSERAAHGARTLRVPESSALVNLLRRRPRCARRSPEEPPPSAARLRRTHDGQPERAERSTLCCGAELQRSAATRPPIVTLVRANVRVLRRAVPGACARRSTWLCRDDYERRANGTVREHAGKGGSTGTAQRKHRKCTAADGVIE